jgi:uncharacterized protein YdbL (DUF1318 family)
MICLYNESISFFRFNSVCADRLFTQGTTVDLVGKVRAKQIVQKAKPGQWIQDQSGKWYQKK